MLGPKGRSGARDLEFPPMEGLVALRDAEVELEVGDGAGEVVRVSVVGTQGPLPESGHAVEGVEGLHGAEGPSEGRMAALPDAGLRVVVEGEPHEVNTAACVLGAVVVLEELDGLGVELGKVVRAMGAGAGAVEDKLDLPRARVLEFNFHLEVHDAELLGPAVRRGGFLEGYGTAVHLGLDEHMATLGNRDRPIPPSADTATNLGRRHGEAVVPTPHI
mmetsp:Transcript_27116/g.78952  ORF Transcript_27116/g.78952 Transcript_27116/m.78952 type:complete len:218 (-) Transcript_27116:494-1147(-)